MHNTALHRAGGYLYHYESSPVVITKRTLNYTCTEALIYVHVHEHAIYMHVYMYMHMYKFSYVLPRF